MLKSALFFFFLSPPLCFFFFVFFPFFFLPLSSFFFFLPSPFFKLPITFLANKLKPSYNSLIFDIFLKKTKSPFKSFILYVTSSISKKYKNIFFCSSPFPKISFSLYLNITSSGFILKFLTSIFSFTLSKLFNTPLISLTNLHISVLLFSLLFPFLYSNFNNSSQLFIF